MRRLLLLLSLLLLGLIYVTAGGCGSDEETPGGDDTGSSAATISPTSGSERSPAPSFTGQTLSGFDVSLESFAGKPLVLIFWASW